MPRRFLQRYMPKPDTIRRQRSLRFMAPLIADPGLWLLTRRSVANAFSVGLFCAMLPIPFQMVVAALGARLARCNLALSVGLVWVTNPLTMPLTVGPGSISVAVTLGSQRPAHSADLAELAILGGAAVAGLARDRLAAALHAAIDEIVRPSQKSSDAETTAVTSCSVTPASASAAETAS